MARFRVITWNINSAKARADRLAGLLERHDPDVMCLQETKVKQGELPLFAYATHGYEAAQYGEGGYNGVAILSKHPLTDVVKGFDGDPVPEQARVIHATVTPPGAEGGIRIVSAYVVNGKGLDDPAYAVKLEWLAALRRTVKRRRVEHNEPALITGDFNITPDDRDVHDPGRWAGGLHCSPAERQALQEFINAGFEDVLRRHTDEAGIHTWWDYRMGAFARDWGLRIDLGLATPDLPSTVHEVDRDERKQGDWESKPSDHAPVIMDFEVGP